jgi:hypothetical protein
LFKIICYAAGAAGPLSRCCDPPVLGFYSGRKHSLIPIKMLIAHWEVTRLERRNPGAPTARGPRSPSPTPPHPATTPAPLTNFLDGDPVDLLGVGASSRGPKSPRPYSLGQRGKTMGAKVRADIPGRKIQMDEKIQTTNSVECPVSLINGPPSIVGPRFSSGGGGGKKPRHPIAAAARRGY